MSYSVGADEAATQALPAWDQWSLDVGLSVYGFWRALLGVGEARGAGVQNPNPQA